MGSTLVVLIFLLSFLNYRISQQKFVNWFGNNHMKANPGKCHLLLSTKSPEVVSINGLQIPSSTAETLPGITIDSELNVENHLCAICNNVSRKINALGRIANYMPLEKLRILMKTFIESQFKYCPLISMFTHQPSIIKSTAYMKGLLEREIVYSDFKSSYEGLLMKEKSFSWKKRSKFSYRVL